MSEIFPNAYAAFFVVQLVILMVIYVVLRFKSKLRVITSLCLSVLATAALSTPLLWFCPSSLIPVYRADVQEYVAGTLLIAAPFLLILMVQFLVPLFNLMVQFLAPLFKEIISSQKAVGPERARILHMVEEGKITAEEGSDLLEAMGKSSALRGQDSFSRLDMAILCGVALVVMGFFMPWVYVRISGMPAIQGIRNVFDQDSAYQAGYHTGALGWTVFVIALMSAVPVFVTPKNFLYKISILQLFLILVGLLLAISTLLRATGHSGVGIIICAAGFAIELIASGAKFKHLAA